MSTQPVVAPPLPAWIVNRGLMADPAFQVKFVKPNSDVLWASNPGPQTWFLLCPFDEILLGGARGGGKSDGLISWMAMGDPSLPDGDPARYSYLNEPTFRGLLLREEYQSMAEFVERAVEFYKNFGGKPAGNPTTITFESKAKIYFNHLGDQESYNKYKGWNLTKIGVEELTQIPTLRQYLKIFGSLRAVDRMRGKQRLQKLRTQLAATTNPDGPGAMWVKQRFIEVHGADRLIPWNTPMRDKITELTRIFIPARITDNQYLRDDRRYMGMLLAQDDVTQAQWIHGDWNAGAGVFFREYRPDGPRGKREASETPWASHVPEKEPKLQPWWYRWGSGDWGFDHPSLWHKFCRNEQDKRIHVYDELAVRQVGSFELGVMLAKWWMSDLEGLPDHQVTLYFSPDAFSKTDATKTKAEQIESGIKEVLGPYGALLLKYNEDERNAMYRDPKAAAMMFERRKAEFSGHLCIALKPANTDRIAGASYLRELLRFRPVFSDLKPDESHLKKILELRGIEAYEQELAAWRSQKPEVLPKLQLWRVCRQADRCLREAMHDAEPRAEDVRKWDAEDGVGGDDGYDSLRHGVMAYKEIETVMPQRYWVADRIMQIQDQHADAFGETITDPTRLAMIAQRQNALYENAHKSQGGALTIPRSSGRRVQ